MITTYKVNDLMKKKPVIIGPETNMQEVAEVFTKVGSALVCGDHELLGIITKEDLIEKVVAKKKDPEKVYAKDVMITNVITVEPEADVYDVLLKLNKNNIRHLPVMKNKRIVGIISLKDIMDIGPELFELIAAKHSFDKRERRSIFGFKFGR
jgi:signal-transduction protein with cAMP-binding, CBS, and nucleotidyltransferase domain